MGTPDDCVAGIERLQEASGEFGGLLLRAEDWASRDKLHHSYELMARAMSCPNSRAALPE